MYTNHFGFKKLPFENVPDPDFFFDQGDYALIRNQITELLKIGRGLIVMTGPIGSGKTTLSQMIKSDFSNCKKIIWMPEPPGNSNALFLFIAQELGLKTLAPIISKLSKALLIRDIWNALSKVNSKGGNYLLIIDESHFMSDDTLQGISLISDFEEGSNKLIQVLLISQKEIIEAINRPEMQSFKKNVAALKIIGKMDVNRIRHYISHRIEVAGGVPSIFTDLGWEAVVLASVTGGGIPRITNSLCDKCLRVAFEKEKTTVDVNDVYEAAKEMGIDKEVFHYMIALRSNEQKQQISYTRKNDSIRVLKGLRKWPLHLFKRDITFHKAREKDILR